MGFDGSLYADSDHFHQKIALKHQSHHLKHPKRIPHHQNALQVLKVKRHQNGFLMDPFVLTPEDTIEKIDELKHLSGFSTCPITLHGKATIGPQHTQEIKCPCVMRA